MVLINGQIGCSLLWNDIQASITEKQSEKSPSVKQYLYVGIHVNLILCPLFSLEYKLVLIEIIHMSNSVLRSVELRMLFMGRVDICFCLNFSFV